jgi:hypothetical protein
MWSVEHVARPWEINNARKYLVGRSEEGPYLGDLDIQKK